MNILAVDDSPMVLKTLVRTIGEVEPQANIFNFTDPETALEELKKNCKELFMAFLDIEMFKMNGLQLAAELKKLYPQVLIIFVTAFSEYTMDAFKVHANGYLMKPITADKLKEEIAEITKPHTYESHSRVKVHTFGNFEVFVDGKPVKFARSKSKELFAFLIDRRGASCTMNELVSALFEDSGENKSQQKYIRTLIADMKSALAKFGINDIVCKEHNSICLDISKISCDYYEFLEGDSAAVNSFFGEYMSNYSWAEFTVAQLCRRCSIN